MYLVIEGNIGAGKTTLAKKIAKEYNGILVLEEFIENPYLPTFYEENGANAYQLEISFLKTRYLQLTELFKDQADRLIVSDFHFEKSRIFASINLNYGEFQQYDDIFRQYNKQIPVPDLIIFLEKPVSELLNNIQKRGRSFESKISEQYLENIGKNYEKFIQEHVDSTVVKVDKSVGFLSQESKDYKLIVNAINEKL